MKSGKNQKSGKIWHHPLMARRSASHADNQGSNPCGVTIWRYRLRWLGHQPFTLENRDRHPVASPMQFLNCDEKR